MDQRFTHFSLQFLPFYRPTACWQVVNMMQEMIHLLWRKRRSLGEMAMNPIRLVLKCDGTGQMIEGILAHPMNQVLGRIERGRVGRRVQELHRRTLQVLPARECDDLR
jgi:hypothetical protein